MEIPVTLYNIDNKKIDTQSIIMRSVTFFFYSIGIIKVKVIDGPGVLFSVNEQMNEDGTQGLVASTNTEFNNNTGYTLYCNGDDTIVEITNSFGTTSIYKFLYRPSNILSDAQEHYNDLIINYYLPTFEELEPALLPGTEKSDLLKRLLLDFKDIMRSKGTKASIEKFFYFIGFTFEQIKVLEEYRKNKTNPDADLTLEEKLSWISQKNITTNPDTTVDTKTGNYHVLFNNWDDKNQNGIQDVNRKNMPYRPFAQQDFDKFFGALKYGIALANKYFTLVEQEITFFGISFSVNIPMYQSVTSTFNKIFVNDLCAFRRFLHIDLYYNYVTTSYEKVPNYIIKNTLQKDNKAYRSETKFIEQHTLTKDPFTNKIIPTITEHDSNIFIVNKEIADNEKYEGKYPELVKRQFGVILHANVKSPNTYVQITIQHVNIPEVKLIVPKQLVEDTLHVEYFNVVTGDYKIIFEVWDKCNTYEKYFYDYSIQDDVRLLDIDTFTSHEINESNFDKNHINLDVDSGTITSEQDFESKHYILPVDKIPENLKEYWSVNPGLDLRWLTKTNVSKKKQLFLLPEINKNYKVAKVTDTIPVTYTEQWLEFIVIPYIDVDTLYVKTYNADEREYQIRKLINENWELDPVFNKLFVRRMMIHDQELTTVDPWLFICPIETGINMCKDTFDILVKIGEDSYQSIYDNNQLITKQIPVNFDFPLFPIKETDEDFIFSCITSEYPIVKSIFPRLQKDAIEVLALGDIIMCRLNADRVCSETDVTWTILDAFDGTVLYTTNDYALKYRITKNSIYTIKCEFTVNGTLYNLTKTGLISSWLRNQL